MLKFSVLALSITYFVSYIRFFYSLSKALQGFIAGLA